VLNPKLSWFCLPPLFWKNHTDTDKEEREKTHMLRRAILSAASKRTPRGRGGGRKEASALVFCAPCFSSSSFSSLSDLVLGALHDDNNNSTMIVNINERKDSSSTSSSVDVLVNDRTPEDIFSGFPGYAPPGVDVMLMAVPKAKVTPSRKKRRNQFKRVEFVRDARKCPTCRKPMRSWHNFCCPPKDEKEDVVYSTTTE